MYYAKKKKKKKKKGKIVLFFFLFLAHLVSEENAVVIVIVNRVDPRVANEVDKAFTGNIFKGESLEEELIVVIVSDYESAGNSDILVPIECHLERCVACRC
ncbi:hypothetical protein L484_000162 [Morus notabilis]|uniref:Uncharacterized protein n=1 Tax=Morus notabilis TaxID=981085 RepID=W9T2W9_9ROSA|nr:hypothetical protein L484_000162 [Morus notabilis]